MAWEKDFTTELTENTEYSMGAYRSAFRARKEKKFITLRALCVL
jgi:hypothetical protein